MKTAVFTCILHRYIMTASRPTTVVLPNVEGAMPTSYSALSRQAKTLGFILLASLLFILSISPARAAGERHAAPTAKGTGDCSSWANACTLQTALTGAIAGDEIWVMAGVHKPTTVSTERDASFELINEVAIYGGFAGTETARDQRDPTTNITVLSGDIDDNDTTDANGIVMDPANIVGNNSYHVITSTNVISMTILDGVTITAGQANSSDGGGMRNDNSSPTLINITFSGNSAYNGGGIGNIDASSPTLTDVTFRHNSATWGGGAMANMGTGSPNLTNVTFYDNEATEAGGGIYNLTWGNLQLTNVTFYQNVAGFNGGAIYADNSSPVLTNVTFFQNSATNGFGGAIFSRDSNFNIRNAIFSDNPSYNDPLGQISYHYNIGLVDSIVHGSGCPPSDSDTGRTSYCTNVLSDDPLLGAFGDYGGATQTIPLLPGSPAIGLASADCPDVDQRGITRSNPCDSGAFESQGFSLSVTGGDMQSTPINMAFGIPLQVSVTANVPVEPIDGGMVTFSVPTSGASAALSSSMATIAAGTASVTATANNTLGAYQVSASARGTSAVTIDLENIQIFLFYTAPAATGNRNCTTWVDTCTLQTALTYIDSGTEIWAKMGVHKPTSTSNRTESFVLIDDVEIYGGFAGTETTREERDPTANVTILSGDIDNNDINADGNYIAETYNDIQGDNSYHVVIANGISNNTVLDGFTITAGLAVVFTDDYGGGLLSTNSNLTLTNMIFSGNKADNSGGGMSSTRDSNSTLINVTFSGNTAYAGGGLHNYNSAATLVNTTFNGNSTHVDPTVGYRGPGGGIYNSSSTGSSGLVLTNATFSNNTAYSGGGMRNYNSTLTLTNVTFSRNTADGSGGGLFLDRGGVPTIYNTIFWGNNASFDAQIASYADNEFNIYDSVIEGGCPARSTCTNLITDNPMLGALGDYGGATATIPLLVGSSAIDAGDDATCATMDQRGENRDDWACDIGAYEVKFSDSDTASKAVSSGNSYTFGSTLVKVDVVNDAGCLTNLNIQRIESNHPQATDGIQTGRYWQVTPTGCDNHSDLDLTLTLPTDLALTGKDKACRWDTFATQWDCGQDSANSSSSTGPEIMPNIVTRQDVNQLSDWAVGRSVGPTAVTLSQFAAAPMQLSNILWLGLIGLLCLVGVMLLVGR